MEVHHHAHTERKRFKHYLWEFLMLFLAVFAGFLAENQREHLVEHQREKQYMRSMVEDLRADITHLSTIIGNFESIVFALDTLNEKFPKLNKGFSAPIYRNIVTLMGYEDLIPNDRTMQQLKNAGGMRLIRKQDVSDSITRYDKKLKDLQIEQSAIGDLLSKLRDIGEIIDAELWKGDNDKNIVQYSRENRDILLTHDKSLLGKYDLWMLIYQGAAYNYLAELKETSSYAERLIDFIQKEYKIK